MYINVQSDALKKLGIAVFDNIDIIYLIKYIIKFYTNIKMRFCDFSINDKKNRRINIAQRQETNAHELERMC